METLKAVTKAHTKLITSLLLIVGLVFTGCDVNDDDGSKGTMRVSLTDAPANYAAVNIEIEQVLVKKSDEDGDDEEDTEGMDDEELEEQGWVVIFNDQMTVNLLDYRNGALLDLGEAEVDAGMYEEVRFVLGDNNTIETNSGSTYNLTTPSAQTSGYKLKINTAVEAGEVADLVIDFDASQSIVVTGAGSFLLKPVLRTVEADEKATISGIVNPLEAEAWIYTIADGDTVSTQPNEEGSFTLYGLEEGSYDVTIDAQNEAYIDTTVTGIMLEENENFEFESAFTLESTGQIQ
jgi:hypothetical protein